jgi:hypothetical protein
LPFKGYIGIGIHTSSAKSIVELAESTGSSPVAVPFGEFAFGASSFPDEDEMKRTKTFFGQLTDPEGLSAQLLLPPAEVEIEIASPPSPRAKVVLGVVDLEESVAFYCAAPLGLELTRKRSNVNSIPKEASIVAHLVPLHRLLTHSSSPPSPYSFY